MSQDTSVPKFARRLRIYAMDVPSVGSLVMQHKQGRCVMIEESGATFIDCIDAVDAADVRIAFPRTRYE